MIIAITLAEFTKEENDVFDTMELNLLVALFSCLFCYKRLFYGCNFCKFMVNTWIVRSNKNVFQFTMKETRGTTYPYCTLAIYV